MADVAALATGNFLTAGTWGLADTTSKLVSTSTAVTALTTGNLDSAVFQPGAITVIGVLIRLGARATGTPTNKMTITLRNSTGGVDVASVVVNVSDLPACSTTDDEGGWHFLKFSASHLLLAATDYLIRATLDSTSTAVSLCTNGTANNWQRLLVTSTTQAPVAGDDMYVVQVYDGATNPATVTAVTVTMNETASTDYGSNTSNYRTAAMSVSKGGTLAWPTSSNSLLRLSGFLVQYSGSVVSLGTSGAKVDRGVSCVLEFDATADGSCGWLCASGSTGSVWAQSRTSGKNVFYTTLTSDAAAAATTLNVAADTGWKSGDEIVISASARTYSQHELRVLNTDAGASSMVVTSGLTHNHGQTSDADLQTDVALITRDARVRSVSSTLQATMAVNNGATFTAEWASFRYITTITCSTQSANFSFDYCVVYNTDGAGFAVSNALILFTLRRTFFYSFGTAFGANGIDLSGTIAGTSAWTIDECIFIGCGGGGGGGGTALTVSLGAGTLTNNRVSSSFLHGFVISAVIGTSGAFSGNRSNRNNSNGMSILASSTIPYTLSNTRACLNGAAGITTACLSANNMVSNLTFDTLVLLGNTTTNMDFPTASTSRTSGWALKSATLAGVSGFATTTGIAFTSPTVIGMRWESCSLGVATGIRVAHTTDITLGAVSASNTLRMRNTTLASATEIGSLTNLMPGSCISSQRHDGVAAAHKSWGVGGGVVEIETGTVDVSPGIKMTPATASYKLDTACGQTGRGFLIRVLDTQQPTISVKVRKNGAYNGSAPRLILRGNSALGLSASDVVLDTLSVGADTWETLSAQIPSPVTDNGVVEVVVDCDGTAGSVFVDTVSA